MGVTIKDIAKLAGVSTATVSRVVNNDPRVSEETREKVLKYLEKSHYKVNNIARSLKTNKSHTIGFLCPELPNIFFMMVAKGVEDELKKRGYSLIVCSSNENINEEENYANLLCEKCVDGVIIIPVSNKGMHFNQFREAGIPVILVDRITEDFNADVVVVDNINGSYEAIEYLIKQGVKRIGYIGGNLQLSNARERDEGYKRALNDYYIPVDESIIRYGDMHAQSGYEKMKELLETNDPPQHIFISNYFMHVGAVKYLAEQNNEVTRRVSLTVFDDIELSSFLGFNYVLISQPMVEMGNKAVQLLLDRINGDNRGFPQLFRLKTKLKINN